MYKRQVLGVVLAAGLIVGIKCMERVPAGYVGVVYNFSSGISDQVLTQGWHFVSPTKKVTTYSVGIEPVSYTHLIMNFTKDALV